MRNNWQIKKLGELCDIEIGRTPYRGNSTFWDKEKKTKNVWLSIADLLNTEGNIVSDSKEYISNKGSNNSRIVKAGTLLVSFKLTLGRLAFAGRDLYTNEAIAALNIKNDKEILKEYLYQYLNFFDWQRAAEGDTKVKGKTLNKTKLKEIEILVPPISEQHRIVKVLDEVFEKVEKAKENTEKNLKNARDLFESYLTNIFANPGDDWEEKTLGQISDNLDSRRVPVTRNIRNKGSIPYYGASGVVDYVADYLFDEDLLCISEDGANLLARTYPIAFSISGKTWVNNHAHVLRFEKKETQKFVEYYLNSIKLNSYVSGMAQPKLNQKMLNSIIIPCPSLPEQKNIVYKINLLSDQIKKLEEIYKKKLDNLEELKKSILNKAFTGEL